MRSSDLTEFSMKIPTERGISLIAADAIVETVIHLLPHRRREYSFTAAAEREIARDDMAKLTRRKRHLVGAKLFRCVEVLFQQSFSSKKTTKPRHFSPVS